MADTFIKQVLSGSSYGKQIKVTGTASGAVTVHTTPSGTSIKDEIWLYATNSQATPVELTLEWGGVSSPDDQIKVQIPPKAGLFLIIPGLILQNGCVITAFASTANVIMLNGYVNRITTT